jgi:hypothetical protein
MEAWATFCTTPAEGGEGHSDWQAGAFLSRWKFSAFAQRPIFRGAVFVST